MRNLKKILALALALVMTLSLMTVANAFTDDQNINDTYEEAVDVLNGMGVFQGYTDGSFAPKGEITRAEVAAIIYRIVTGDVKDTQVKIYSDYAKFDDVKSSAWYAGYVGFCANAEYIKGYGDGNFGPNDKVTGYQALAMILRAMGYDQNGEFTGSGWEIRVASTAQQRGILVNIAERTLGTAATRELVAEILFQAIQKNTVVYTPALGYYTADLLGGVATTSLGYKTFGLASTYGYITGNQATGEAVTVLGEYPAVTVVNNTTSWVKALNTTTGLDVFGHYTKVWYNAKQSVATVYASYDLGTSTTVTQAEYLALANKAEYFSNSYGTIDAVSTVWDYNVLVTNPGTQNDVLVRLNLDIAQYTAINRFVTVPYLTVFSGEIAGTKTIALANATGYESIALGSYVNVLTVTGTNSANTAFPQAQLSALTGFSGVTVKYVAKDGTITLNDGSTVKSSSATHKWYASRVNSAMTIPNVWSFNTVYNIYTDMFGNYVGAIAQSDAAYAKLVYAYYETVPSTGEITYYGQVVRNDGATEVVKLAVNAVGYNALTCTKLDIGNNLTAGNAITAGEYMDVVLQPTAAGMAIAHVQGDGDCTWVNDVVSKVGLTTVNTIDATVNTNGGKWTVTAATKSVGNNKNYFVDASTKFVVVSGFGGTLSVTTYTGVTELLQGNVSATIDGKSVVTYTQVYSENIGSANFHVDYVLITSSSLTPASQLIYIEDASPVGYVGGTNYYDAYIAGELQKALPIVAATGVVLQDQTFYSYKLVNGVYVLQAESPAGCIEDYTLTVVAGTAYLYVNDASNNQYPITEAAKIVNLTNVQNVPTTAADLMKAAENNVITVDVEIVSGAISVVYIVGYNAAQP